VVFFISVLRFVRLGWCLYRYWGKTVLPEAFAQGAVAPDLLARYALANRVRCTTVRLGPSDSGSIAEHACGNRVLCILRVAETSFLYLWEKCHSDVESGKRACVLTLLLSFLVVIYGANPIYHGYREGSRLTGYACLLLTLQQLLSLLAFGLSLCTVLYLVASFFEGTLADRKACWKYFCAKLQNELLHE
jgi:hypothetical protein